MRRAFTCAAKVKIETWRAQLKGYAHAAIFGINLDEADRAFEVFLVRAYRYVLVMHWNAEACAGDHILSVLRDERGGVVTAAIRNFQNLFSPEA